MGRYTAFSFPYIKPDLVIMVNMVSPITQPMLLHQFNRLVENKCYHHILLHGVCVADRNTESEDYLLFQLRNLYKEVAFVRHTDQLLWLSCFRDTKALDPYLENVPIETVMDE